MTRLHGTLVKWDEARGFGFVLPAQGNTDLFVHVSAFPRPGSPPRVGELVSFEIETAPDGRHRAVRVWRAGGAPARRVPSIDAAQTRRLRHDSSSHRMLSRIAYAAGVGALLLFATGQLRNVDFGDWSLRPHADEARNERIAPVATIAADDRAAFTCDGRTRCSQMSSCAEATFFLRHCPNVQMDGDHDGIPCEQQWCTQ